jgi:hypothetical protein
MFDEIEHYDGMLDCWKRYHHFGKSRIGQLFESYIAYLYSSKGFIVNSTTKYAPYDLVCKKGNKVILIQCKNWRPSRLIRSNIIYHMRGALDYYKIHNKNQQVIGLLVSTHEITEDARNIADEMLLKHEVIPMDYNFPQVKCNISVEGKKRYFLPWSIQYKLVSIDLNKGEFYANSVKEAVESGFIRAKEKFLSIKKFDPRRFLFWTYCKSRIRTTQTPPSDTDNTPP